MNVQHTYMLILAFFLISNNNFFREVFVEILSGLRVNSSKTEGLWIGSLKKSDSKPLGIKWPNEPIKALHVGAFFTMTILCSTKIFFRQTIVNIKKLINIWSSRRLSIFGKIFIIKSLLLSKLMYISSLLPTPTYITKKVNRLLFKFVCKGVDKVTCKIVEDREGRNGGFLLFNCNYNIDHVEITSKFLSGTTTVVGRISESFAEEKDLIYYYFGIIRRYYLITNLKTVL